MIHNIGRMCNTLQSPNEVLSILARKTQSDDYKFKRLYRNLYNPKFYYMAYKDMAPKEGNMTAGTDGCTIDGMSINRIDKLIEQLKSFSYQPKPVRRTYIPKKGNTEKVRPLGIPSTDDKMVQYVIKYILEAIYENQFSDSSHGFRPNRSCHTALKQIKAEFKGVKWFVEGDIKGFFDNIDHHKLVNILRRKITDEHFIGLIWKFLKAGYAEEWRNYPTYSGTPQGGIISPILANIYLNELDTYMNDFQNQFNIGEKRDRTRNQDYRRLELRLTRLNRKLKPLWPTMSQEERKANLVNIKEIRQDKLKLPYYIPQDTGYKRLKYVRYADDFLIGITGSKSDAMDIKEKLKAFLSEKLSLELSDEKTLITFSNDKARFLAHDIVITRDFAVSRDKLGRLKRSFTHCVRMYLPFEIWRDKLLSLKAMKINYGTGNKEVWKSWHRPHLSHLDDLEILSKYNAEIRGYHNYYRFADNSTVLQKFYYIMEYSMYKTFANKYKSNVGKIKDKYCINGIFTIKYKVKKGENQQSLYHESFAKQDILKTVALPNADAIPNTFFVFNGSSLIDRLKAEYCELCGKEDVPLEMHHVKKLKNLKGKTDWEILMIAKRRKTLALCLDCHCKINLQQRQVKAKTK